MSARGPVAGAAGARSATLKAWRPAWTAVVGRWLVALPGLALAVLLLGASHASASLGTPVVSPPESACAAPVFLETFEAPGVASVAAPPYSSLNYVLPAARWTTLLGYTDLYDPRTTDLPGSFVDDSQFIDLDGSNHLAAHIQEAPPITLAPGDTATLQWLEAGNQRSAPDDTMTVRFTGTPWTMPQAVPWTSGWSAQSSTWTNSGASTVVAHLEFDMDGTDQMGILIDDVRICVTSAPPPQAAFATVAPTGCATTFAFTDQSVGAGGPITAWQWDFGDGTTSTAPSPTHAFASAGTSTVTLRVTDGNGHTGTVTHDVTWTGLPSTCCVILQPVGSFTVREGMTLRFQADGRSLQGLPVGYSLTAGLPGTIDATGRFTWQAPAGSAGIYRGEVVVSDGSCTAAQPVTIEVLALDPGSDADADMDGVQDSADNCPTVPNHDQADADGNGRGDACESSSGGPAGPAPRPADRPTPPKDTDLDGVPDDVDRCPNVPDAGQADLDGDGMGDACDPDGDGDGVPDSLDDCPRAPDPLQSDLDQDGAGDACQGHAVRLVAAHASPAPAASATPAAPLAVRAQAQAGILAAAVALGLVGAALAGAALRRR